MTIYYCFVARSKTSTTSTKQQPSAASTTVTMTVGCSPWTRRQNTAAKKGAFLGWLSESDCIAACLNSMSCVAFDMGPIGCVLHHSAEDLITGTYNVPGITQFVLNRQQCLITSPRETEHPPTTTTTSFQRLTGSWLCLNNNHAMQRLLFLIIIYPRMNELSLCSPPLSRPQ